MLVGCSEIIISVIVKHFLGFLVPRGTEKIAKLLFARGISTEALSIDRDTGVCKAILDAGMLT